MRKPVVSLLSVSLISFGIISGLLCGGAMAAVPPKTNAAVEASVQHSKQLPVPIVAIVDVQRILQESLAAKSVQQQLEAHRSKFQVQISHEETDLRQAEQELTHARETLKPEAYAEKEQQLRQRFLAEERHVQARRKALDQAFSDSMNVVRTNLLEVVDKTAHEHGANLVIVKQQALWSDKDLDITDEVLRRLDQSLSKVPVKVPVEEIEKAKDAKDAP